MSDIRRRVKKAEKALNVTKEHTTVTIVRFGGTLPPDRTEGNITYHFVMCDRKAKQ